MSNSICSLYLRIGALSCTITAAAAVRALPLTAFSDEAGRGTSIPPTFFAIIRGLWSLSCLATVGCET